MLAVNNILKYIPSVLRDFSPFLAWYASDFWSAASASAIVAFENPVLMVETRERRGNRENVGQPGGFLLAPMRSAAGYLCGSEAPVSTWVFRAFAGDWVGGDQVPSWSSRLRAL